MKDEIGSGGCKTLAHTAERVKGIPKEREVNRSREVCEWEGWVWVSEAVGAPSMLRLIRRSVVNQMN